MRAPPVLPGSSISSLQDIKTKSVPRYRYSLGIFERSSEGKGEKQKRQTKRLLAGKERVNSCYACAHGAHRVGGDGRRLPGAMFSPEVPSLLRADAFSLPHLSSPLPVPVRVLVPGWCFLVTAAAVSMCVTDPEQPVAGGPSVRPPSRPPGRGTSACSLAGLRVPHLSPTRGGARLVAPQWCSAPGGSADCLGCLLLPAGPKSEVVIRKELGSHGLGVVVVVVGRGSTYFPSVTSRILLPFREAG